MDKCDYKGALTTINLLREEYKKDPPTVIIKDIVYIGYSNSTYILYFAIVNEDGNVLTMEWPIDVWFTIPAELRNCAKENAGKKIIIDENNW